MDKYLPIGSVVLLKNGRKKIMIYGRKQMHVETGEEWDYLACLYPEGNSMPIFDSYNAAIPHLSNPYNTPEAVLRTSYCHFPHILCNG